MGSYSYLVDENIQVKDLEGLKAFIERFKKFLRESDEWWMSKQKMSDNEFEEEWAKHHFNIVIEDDKGKEYVSFERWNDIKLISYWYPTTCLFLHCVSKYIEGSVTWEFESREEDGWVEFKNGQTIVHTAVQSWSEWKPDSMIMESRDDKKEFERKRKFLFFEEL